MTLNSNQFAQVPVKGQIDMSIKDGKIGGMISANQATSLYPGQRVKLDTAAQVFTPSFVAAAVGDVAIGIIAYNTKQSAFAALEAVEIILFGGPVYYAEAAAAITAGALVEGVAGAKVQTHSAQQQTGIALDGASAAGDLIRVICTEPVIVA